jgi:outer membrane receptor protein involved in Fe transport
MLAAAAAALTPLASSQVSSPPGSTTAEATERVFKYQATAGYSYTSLNQLNQSRSGLQGVELSVTRDFGKHFGVIADGAYYKYAIKSGNPGDPSVDLVLFGPVFHADLYGRLSGFARALLGGEHTAGNGTIPNVSVAGGVGIGMEYSLTPRIALRAAGDDIYSSFVQDPKHLGYSPHERSNGRGSLSVVFRF